MSTAVLLSGGLDSAVLVAEEAARPEPGQIQPIYVSVGLAWERAERRVVERFLTTAPLGSRLRPLVQLAVDMSDVYPAAHWAMQGRPPAYHTPDEDVYLPGRNVVLLAKAGVYCATAQIDRIVLGTLDHNPFPDATPAFRAALASALSLGLAHHVTIDAPYARVSKAEVIRRGAALRLPLELTLSCMSPVEAPARPAARPERLDPGHDVGPFDELRSGVTGLAKSALPRHCGVCSKCRERHDGFLDAGIADPTDYADRTYTGG